MSNQTHTLVRLRDQMDRRGLTTETLSDKTGISPSWIDKFTTGYPATEAQAQLLANALCCYVPQLTGKDNLDSFAGKFGRSTSGKMSIREDNAGGYWPEMDW